jgi:cellulose synthase/poly-beta-1,6-N-acetylglucosamine synthase-like glycosyltransferase
MKMQLLPPSWLDARPSPFDRPFVHRSLPLRFFLAFLMVSFRREFSLTFVSEIVNCLRVFFNLINFLIRNTSHSSINRIQFTMAQKQLSVIVPTYNETENIRPLCERLFKVLSRATAIASCA